MARLPRLYVPHIPHLVLVKFRFALEEGGKHEVKNQLQSWLGELSAKYQIAMHGWSISESQIRLLATPSEANSLSRLMQSLGRNWAAQFETGSVFSGRYHSTVVEPSAWVLPSLIWLETYDDRGQYQEGRRYYWPWSSSSLHHGQTNPQSHFLQQHKDYWQLGNTPFDRQAHYSALVNEGLSDQQRTQIEQAIKGQWALGSPDFLAQIGYSASRRLQPQKRGRPNKLKTVRA